MDSASQFAALEANARAIAALAGAMPTAGVRWRPTPDDWSVLEVVNHLADEENEDFRALLDGALHRPESAVLPIEPKRWVTDRAYNAQDFAASLARFLAARAASLVWLHGLDAPDWSHVLTLPHGQRASAGDLLAAWAAHDLLHARQLVEIQYAYRVAHAAPYSVAYAGKW